MQKEATDIFVQNITYEQHARATKGHTFSHTPSSTRLATAIRPAACQIAPRARNYTHTTHPHKTQHFTHHAYLFKHNGVDGGSVAIQRRQPLVQLLVGLLQGHAMIAQARAQIRNAHGVVWIAYHSCEKS